MVKCLSQRTYKSPRMSASVACGVRHRKMYDLDDLLLCSLKTIRKETVQVPPRLGRASPRLGSGIEMSGRDAGGLPDPIGIGKALASQRIAAEEAPPALLTHLH